MQKTWEAGQFRRRAVRLLVAASFVAATACGGSGGADEAGEDGGGDDGEPDPTESACEWEQGQRPTATLPPTHTNEYALDLATWEIDNNAGDPVETRQRINEAIAWAVDEGFDKVLIPGGHYMIGELTNDIYAAGIELPGNMTLELSDDTIIEMMPNDRHNYCVISVEGNDDITIRGGVLRGDRDAHEYSGGTAHDEGHGVCVWTSANRVLIEDTEMTQLTGDGVLIVGSAPTEDEDGVPSTHITIRNNEIHHNRRNGIAIVGGHNVVVENNHIHHIQGTAPQFGIDIEGAGRRDQDILIFQNNFHDNGGGDFVTSSGRNVWLEENTMTQCQVDEQGEYDPDLPCENDEQVDGPIVLWQNTDNVVINNVVRMTAPTVNGMWGIINYPSVRDSVRDNPVGNNISGNTFHGCGIHSAWNQRQRLTNNTLNEGTLLGYLLECTRLEDNHINRVEGQTYMLRNVAGQAQGNIVNREAGAPAEADTPVHFPMADDSPYRNSSPVFW